MWELDHKESWVSKNWCFGTVVLEETLESPLDCKEIQPVIPKGNQPWLLLEGLILKLKLQYSGHLIRRTNSLEKTLMLGKMLEKAGGEGAAEDKMVWEHHWLNWHEFEQTGDPGGQRSLACCRPWSCRVDGDSVTEQQQQSIWAPAEFPVKWW